VPTVPTTRPWQPPTPAQSTPHWTAPTAWGPNRTKPFGQTPTGPQTIPTTTTAPPKEPVPFMTNCGRARYVEDDVSNALIAGCYYKNKTRTVNKSEYPRPFQNLYNFNFEPVTGPFFEFPLIASAPYVGGKFENRVECFWVGRNGADYGLQDLLDLIVLFSARAAISRAKSQNPALVREGSLRALRRFKFQRRLIVSMVEADVRIGQSLGIINLSLRNAWSLHGKLLYTYYDTLANSHLGIIPNADGLYPTHA
jgi:hypothetical protein